jgi:hypothetical protein
MDADSTGPEDRSQLVIADDITSIIRVLKISFLDVLPDSLHRLRSRKLWVRAKEGANQQRQRIFGRTG